LSRVSSIPARQFQAGCPIEKPIPKTKTKKNEPTRRRIYNRTTPGEKGGLGRVLRPAAKAAGLERVTWHQLRHIHASVRVLHDIGVPAKIAQQQLGHATVETTLNFYTHAIPDTHRRAIESLEQALFPVVPKLGILAKRRNL
jgi:integrase